jgi:hypothetical protein
VKLINIYLITGVKKNSNNPENINAEKISE